MEIARIREEGEQFYQAITREYYLHRAGYKGELELQDIYDQFSHLFSVRALHFINLRKKQTTDEEEKKQLRHLSSFVLEQYVEEAVRHLTEKITTAESKAVVRVEREDCPFCYLPVLLCNQPNRDRRRNIYQSFVGEIDKLNNLRRERLEHLHDLSRELGFQNYVYLCESIRNVNIQGMVPTLKSILKETDIVYRDNLRRECEKAVGLGFEQLRRPDAPYLFRGARFDHYFPEDQLLPIVKKTLEGLGIDLDSQNNLKLDLETREGKQPRALCYPVSIPEEIYLTAIPQGGREGYQSFLHEVGYAQHFAHMGEDCLFEFKRLGDQGVSETFAFLFQDLTLNPLWLEDMVGMKEQGEYLRQAYLSKLYFIRRYAGKILYEIRLHDNRPVAHKQEEYQTIMARACGMEYDKEFFLFDLDEGFYSVSYLRAWMFEAQLRRVLIDKYGPRWYQSKDAGRFLIDLWHNGQYYTLNELAQQLGYQGLDHRPLLEEIHKGLQI